MSTERKLFVLFFRQTLEANKKFFKKILENEKATTKMFPLRMRRITRSRGNRQSYSSTLHMIWRFHRGTPSLDSAQRFIGAIHTYSPVDSKPCSNA